MKWFRDTRLGAVVAWPDDSERAAELAAVEDALSQDQSDRTALYEEITPESGDEGGGSLPADSINLIVTDKTVGFPQDTETMIENWHLDGDILGDFFTLDVDSTHIVVPEACVVAVNCAVAFQGLNDSVWSFLDVYGDGGIWPDDGENSYVFPVLRPDFGMDVGMGNYTLRFTAAGRLWVQVSPIGGSGTDRIALAGMSIHRLA